MQVFLFYFTCTAGLRQCLLMTMVHDLSVFVTAIYICQSQLLQSLHHCLRVVITAAEHCPHCRHWRLLKVGDYLNRFEIWHESVQCAYVGGQLSCAYDAKC